MLLGVVLKQAIHLIKNAKKSFFIIEKIKKYRKCPVLVTMRASCENSRGSRVGGREFWARSFDRFLVRNVCSLNMGPVVSKTAWGHLLAMAVCRCDLGVAGCAPTWWVNPGQTFFLNGANFGRQFIRFNELNCVLWPNKFDSLSQ